MSSRDFGETLKSLSSQGLLRQLKTRPGVGGILQLDGRRVLNFSSNDYLNLACDPRVQQGAIDAIEQVGCGAGASRLMSGHLDLHETLEQRLADFLGYESALVFGSGFLTNLGVLTALAGRGDTIFADRLNHASLIDGARFSGAKCVRYWHNDVSHLETLLKKNDGEGRRIIVTDSVFSMDGDVSPLVEIGALSRQYDALFVVDDAHAVGVIGPGGRGMAATLPPNLRPDFVVGTLSKAFGGYGGFVGCSQQMRDYLINHARSFVYSTGLPPACVGSAIAALDIIESQPTLADELRSRSVAFRKMIEAHGLSVADGETPIVPIVLGDNHKTLQSAEALFDQGVLAVAVRPPTVPEGTSRLRLSLTLAHERDDLSLAAEKIAQVVGEVA